MILIFLFFSESSDIDRKFSQISRKIHFDHQPQVINQTNRLMKTDSSFKTSTLSETKSRKRRKVLTRGAHYTLIKSGGRAPWGSNSQSSTFEPLRRKPRPSYGALRGSIDEYPDRGNTRYSSRNMKRYGGRNLKSRTRQKVSRSLKEEIARYAIEHGAEKAAVKYEDSIGRRLRDRVVEKFVRRYQMKKKKMHRRGKDEYF